MTGGAYTAEASEFLAGIANPRLLKPFPIADLMAEIDGLLAAR